jgi:type IV pilus biogenesis protein CpaD/CtpE
MSKLHDKLAFDHERIEAMIKRTIELLNAPNGLQASALDTNRAMLDQIVSRHLQTLTLEVPAAAERERADALPAINRIAAMGMELEKAYARHKERHILQMDDEADFRASAGLLLRHLDRLLAAERTELLPLIDGL